MRYAIWNDFVAVDVEHIAHPRAAEEVQQLVEQALAAGKHLKAVGAGHSFNDLALNEDILVDLGRLNQVLAVDLERRTVRVQAGIPLRVLIAELEAKGLALPNVGAWTAQTLAGVLSTGTHGTSGRYRKGLLEAAIEIRLIDGRAQERVLTGKDLGALSLGFFGVITEVVLQCEPLFYLRQSNLLLAGERAIESAPEELAQHDFVDLRWVGSLPQVVVRRWDLVPDEPRWIDRAARLYEGAKLGTLNALLSGVRSSGLPRPVENLLFWGLGEGYIRSAKGFPNTAVWHKALTFNSLGLAAPHEEREFAIPRAHATECLLAMRKLMLSDRNAASSLEIQVRYSAPCEVLLAPNDRRETMWFNLNMLAPGRTQELVSRLSEVAYEFDARPHWCKSIPARTPTLRKMYGDAPERWEAIRKSYDPQGLFLNDWYRRYLGFAAASLPEQEEGVLGGWQTREPI